MDYKNYVFKRPDTGKYYSIVNGIARELTDSTSAMESEFGRNIQEQGWGAGTTGYSSQYGGGTTGGAWNLANMKNTIDTAHNAQVPKAQQVSVTPYTNSQMISPNKIASIASDAVYSPTSIAQYTVKSGDTLSKIASQYGVGVGDITGYKSGNPNLIRPGEVLSIKTAANTGTPATQLASLNLPITSAPSNANQIATASSVKIPTVSTASTTAPSYGEISNATGSLADFDTRLNTLIQGEVDRYNVAKSAQEQSSAGQAEQSWLGKLLGTKSPQSSVAESLGMTPNEMYADQKAKIAEINTLNQSYNSTKAAMETELNNTTDKMASTGFISRQQAAIERKYAPTLNRLAADINSKTAVLTQNQELMSKAVEMATAETKYAFDMYTAFKNINESEISKLDSVYKTALENKIAIVKQEYLNDYDMKKTVAEWMIKYPTAGISINDSLNNATTKLVKSGALITTDPAKAQAEFDKNEYVQQFRTANAAYSRMNAAIGDRDSADWNTVAKNDAKVTAILDSYARIMRPDINRMVGGDELAANKAYSGVVEDIIARFGGKEIPANKLVEFINEADNMYVSAKNLMLGVVGEAGFAPTGLSVSNSPVSKITYRGMSAADQLAAIEELSRTSGLASAQDKFPLESAGTVGGNYGFFGNLFK